jgi:membrane-associated phospholipid phosphatase
MSPQFAALTLTRLSSYRAGDQTPADLRTIISHLSTPAGHSRTAVSHATILALSSLLRRAEAQEARPTYVGAEGLLVSR